MWEAVAWLLETGMDLGDGWHPKEDYANFIDFAILRTFYHKFRLLLYEISGPAPNRKDLMIRHGGKGKGLDGFD